MPPFVERFQQRDPICAWCNISMLHVSKDIAKLAMFESQKEVVCTTHLWNLKERKAKA